MSEEAKELIALYAFMAIVSLSYYGVKSLNENSKWSRLSTESLVVALILVVVLAPIALPPILLAALRFVVLKFIPALFKALWVAVKFIGRGVQDLAVDSLRRPSNTVSALPKAKVIK